MLRCSKADFEEVDFFVWKPYLIAARPRGGIEHWVCRPTTSLRERCGHSGEHARGWRKCQQAMQIDSPSERHSGVATPGPARATWLWARAING